MRSRFYSAVESLKPSSLRSRARSWNWHRLIVSFWSCISFIGLGSSLLVFGPTLLDLADHLAVGVGVLAVMFTCRALGSAVGSVASGVVLDKYTAWSYTTLSVVIFSCMATTVVLPLSVHAAMLGAFMFLNGIATGGLDNGVHAVLMRLWGNKSGPCMQLLHFSWAFGAFVAPLIAKRFIQEVYSEFCRNFSSPLNVNELNTTGMNCLTEQNYTSDDNDKPSSQFSYAYYVAASLLLPSLLAFVYYSLRRELFVRCCCSEIRVSTQEERTGTPDRETETQSSSKYPLYYLIVLFTLIFSFMFLYVGLEAGFGSLIFTVAVKGQLKFSKSTAALLQSVYWGTFAFTRLFSFTLALLNVRATIMIMGNLFGSFVASLIMTFYIHNPTAIWIGSAVLGMSYASIFPTVMTWMSENVKASGKATAVLVTGGTMGDITLPAVMGVLVAKVDPDFLIYCTFGGVVVSAGIAALMFLVACVQRRREDHNQTQYKRLNRIPLEEVNSGTAVNGSVGDDTEHGEFLKSRKEPMTTNIDDTELQSTGL